MSEQEPENHQDQDEGEDSFPQVEGEPVTPEDLRSLGIEPEIVPDSRTPLKEAIEFERTRLTEIESILRVLTDVLLYADDPDGTQYSDVAKVSARLLGDTNERLELVVNRLAALSPSPIPVPAPAEE